MSEISDPTIKDMEQDVFAAALGIDALSIDHVSYYSPAEGTGRIVVTAVVEMKKSNTPMHPEQT